MKIRGRWRPESFGMDVDEYRISCLGTTLLQITATGKNRNDNGEQDQLQGEWSLHSFLQYSALRVTVATEAPALDAVRTRIRVGVAYVARSARIGMPLPVHGIHESGNVRLGVRMLDSIVVRVTKNARRLCSFCIVATCTLFNVLSREIGVTAATAAVSSPNGESGNFVACREIAAKPLRAVLVAIVAECPRVVTCLTFDCLRLRIDAMRVEIIDVVDRLSCEGLRPIVALRARRDHSDLVACRKFGQI